MQRKRSHAAKTATRTEHARDVRDWAVVLTHVLAIEPEHLTVLDLARSLDAAPGDFSRPDAVERAVRDLTGAGLLEIAAAEVHPTPAARAFLELLESGV